MLASESTAVMAQTYHTACPSTVPRLFTKIACSLYSGNRVTTSSKVDRNQSGSWRSRSRAQRHGSHRTNTKTPENEPARSQMTRVDQYDFKLSCAPHLFHLLAFLNRHFVHAAPSNNFPTHPSLTLRCHGGRKHTQRTQRERGPQKPPHQSSKRGEGGER